VNIVLIASEGRCGIYEYSQILRGGFETLGHRISYLGVSNWDNHCLFAAVRQVHPTDDLIIVEYEPGIFRLPALVGALVYLRFWRRKPIMLSVHEIEPSKYPAYHHIQQRLAQPVRFGRILEMPRLVWAALDVALHYFSLKWLLFLLGRLPTAIVVHSLKAQENIGLITNHVGAVPLIPHVIKPQEGDSERLRAKLQLPLHQFLFIIPGFLFRRKRIIEVIQQLPAEAGLLIVGTPSVYESDYVAEIEMYLQHHPNPNVWLIQDYEQMEQYLLAADAVVLFYSAAYQSGIAALALGAGKPCIFSNLPAFADYQEAGILVETPADLRVAMLTIQDPAVCRQMAEGAGRLRERYSPARIASVYLAVCGMEG
jgi:glycosyltransferase involved in cell wall biosynthesis